MDGWLSNGAYKYETDSNSFNQALRRASKEIIYMTLNAEVTRANYAANNADSIFVTEKNNSTSIWVTILVCFDVVVVLITIFSDSAK